MDAARTTEAVDAFGRLLRAARTLLARVEPRLAAAGLTITQFSVLAVILRDGPFNQRELSRKVVTSPGNMTDLIDKLETRGLVRRLRQHADRRAVQVELTPSGHAMIAPLAAQHANDVTNAMSGLTQPELQQLCAILAKLVRDASDVVA